MNKKNIIIAYICLGIMASPSIIFAQPLGPNVNAQYLASAGVAMLQRSQSNHGQTATVIASPHDKQIKSPMEICIDKIHSLKKFHEIEKKLLLRGGGYDERDIYAHKFENKNYFTRKDIKLVRAYNEAEIKCFNDNMHSIPGGYNDDDINYFKNAYTDILQLPAQQLKKIRHKVTIGEYNDLMRRIRLTWGYLYVTIRGTPEETKQRRRSAIAKFKFNAIGARDRVKAWNRRTDKK